MVNFYGWIIWLKITGTCPFWTGRKEALREMTVYEIVGGILMLITGILIITVVLLQEGTRGGLASLQGGDSYYNKNQGRTRTVMLAKATKYLAVAFFLITILVYAVDMYQ